jgi:hypothetical protein
MNHHKPRDKLRLLEINFQSIKNKSADLQMAIDSPQPDIIIGTETWLTKDMNSSEWIPNDFEVSRRDRGSDPHGGVLIACRHSLVGSIVHIGKTTEFIGTKVKLFHGKTVIISAAYRPPNRIDGEYIEQLVKDITTVRSQYQSSYFIIRGDFNLPSIDWESSTVSKRRVYIHAI